MRYYLAYVLLKYKTNNRNTFCLFSYCAMFDLSLCKNTYFLQNLTIGTEIAVNNTSNRNGSLAAARIYSVQKLVITCLGNVYFDE